MVVFGERDQIFDAGRAVARYRMVPLAHVVTIPTVGHSPMVEAPQQLSSLIRDFVRTNQLTIDIPS